MTPHKRLYQFNTNNNTQRVLDVDKFGRECSPVMQWRPAATKGTTSQSHAQLWEDAVILSTDAEPGSRLVIEGIIEFSRKL